MSGPERISVLGRRLPKIERRLHRHGTQRVHRRPDAARDAARPRAAQPALLMPALSSSTSSRARALPGVAASSPPRMFPPTVLGSSVRHRPLLADGVVRCFGEPIAAVAAVDGPLPPRALELIEVEYAPLAAVFDVSAATAPGAPIDPPRQIPSIRGCPRSTNGS